MLGVPVPVIIALLVLLTAFVVLKYTRLGRRVYAVGGNAEAARLSGIRIGAIKTVAYVFSGICAACICTVESLYRKPPGSTMIFSPGFSMRSSTSPFPCSSSMPG